jgi:hypothetical protein
VKNILNAKEKNEQKQSEFSGCSTTKRVGINTVALAHSLLLFRVPFSVLPAHCRFEIAFFFPFFLFEYLISQNGLRFIIYFTVIIFLTKLNNYRSENSS